MPAASPPTTTSRSVIARLRSLRRNAWISRISVPRMRGRGSGSLQASVPPRRIGARLLTCPTEVVLGRHPEGKGVDHAEHEPAARTLRRLAQQGGDAGEGPEPEDGVVRRQLSGRKPLGISQYRNAAPDRPRPDR